MNIDPNVWLPLVSGLIGALIGGGASVITVMVQARHEQQRHRIEAVCDMAMKENELHYERMQKAGVGGAIFPPVLFMHYYEKVLTLIESGDLDTKTYKKVCEENDRFRQVIKDIDSARPNSWTAMKEAQARDD